MMKWAMLCCAGSMLLCLAQVALSAPKGGIFIPRNGGYEGRIGKANVFFDARHGGELIVLGGDWPKVKVRATVRMQFQVRIKGADKPVAVGQIFDRSPEIIFLEEGNQRLGLRVKFKLYDGPHGLYHGHGMTETWIYPNGEMFVTAAASFEDPLAHEGVSDARVEIVWPNGRYRTAALSGSSRALQLASLKDPFTVPFDDESLRGRALTFTGDDLPPLSVYWRTGTMQHNTFIYRKEKGAPTYYRWPDYLRQAYMGGVPLKTIEIGQRSVQLRWLPRTSGPTKNATPTFVALLRLAVPADGATARGYVEAEREPVDLAVQGGVQHGNLKGYNDQDGSYEVRKTGDPMTITLPADPAGRTIRVKTVYLRGHGAVLTRLNGKPVVPHLVAEGGIADDPLAPIRELPEGPADMALVTVKLTDRPQTLSVSEVDGVQYAYQTRDRWRNVACFTSQGGPRWSGFKFSLVDGRARNMRAYGRREFALNENLLTWFSFCGFTPVQMVDQLADFEILKNGPDEAVFRYVSTNANARAQSEYIVRVPADSPAMQMNVKATFKVLQSWPYDNCQFFDVFPFRGVWPQDWWYDKVLWLAPDGRAKWMDTVARTYEGDKDLSTLTGGGFFALASSNRGNMVMLTKNFKPELPTHYVICGNYIDYHMEVKFHGPDGKPAPPKKGFEASVEYDLAIWGDAKTTRKELIEIGKKSIKAGKLMLP